MMTVLGQGQVQQPKVEPGFEHIHRFWDQRHQAWSAKILPGEVYVSCHGEMIATVLGSCISVCIRETELDIGGMNHFMLPTPTRYSTEQWGSNPITYASRYGHWAMECLLNEIFKRGGSRNNLEIKVFGGGKILPTLTDIGQRNILFLEEYMTREKLSVAAWDVGLDCSRHVLYWPHTGKVKMKRMRDPRVADVLVHEQVYFDQLSSRNHKSQAGDVDIF